jgi:hypothetical protein
VITTPAQLSIWSIISLRRGARRSTMARGAATAPLITTVSATRRMVVTVPGTPIAAAMAGAPR